MKRVGYIFIIALIVFAFSFSTCFGETVVKLKDYNTVPTLIQGQSYSIFGLIESNKKLTRVEIGVVNAKTNKWTVKYDKKISSTYFSISKADSKIKFGKLKPGTYNYRIYAHKSKKTYTLLNQKFIVKSKNIPSNKQKTISEQQEFLNVVNEGTIKGKIPVDGERGPKTIAAIKLFQQVEGLEVDGVWGKETNKASNKSINVTAKRKAINWACSVANDNSFTYGTGKRAHRSGCYFCKTNTGDRKWNKERKGEPHKVKGHTYTKTYCCNPFITAAYAHGAKDKAMYTLCHRGSSAGMKTSDWTKSKYFKSLGACKKISYSKLKAGDVIMSPTHVWMYIGHNRYVQSSGEGWGAKSISVGNGAKSKYSKYRKSGCYLVRYQK